MCYNKYVIKREEQMAMTQEMRLVKRELRGFKKEIETFEKRSKMIKIVSARDIFNRHYTQIDVVKNNKVVEEMIKYVKNLCEYVEVEKDGTMWLCNYNDLADEDTDYSKAEYNICIRFVK